MHLFVGRELDPRDHELVSVRLMQNVFFLSSGVSDIVFLEGRVDNVVVLDVVPKVFGGGSYDTLLLPLYANHSAQHVWDGEVK